MDDYVSRAEYDERKKYVDAENTRQNRRIEKLEEMSDKLADMAASIKAMLVTMQQMQKEQTDQGERLKKIEAEPGDNWKKFTWAVFACAVTAIAGFVLGKIGI